jgi:hypothetical protein
MKKLAIIWAIVLVALVYFELPFLCIIFQFFAVFILFIYGKVKEKYKT